MATHYPPRVSHGAERKQKALQGWGCQSAQGTLRTGGRNKQAGDLKLLWGIPTTISPASSTSCSNDSASRLRILSSTNPPLAATQLESRARHRGLLAGLNFPVITLKGTEDSLWSLLPKGYSAASAMLYGKVGTGTRPCGERPLASTCHIVLHTAQDHPSGCCAATHEGSQQCL